MVMAPSGLTDTEDDGYQSTSGTYSLKDEGRGGAGGRGGEGGKDHSGKPPIPVSQYKLTRFMRALFLFQLTTEAYVSVRHLVPWFLEDGAVSTSVWLLQLVVFYLCVVMVTNWVCVIRYSSEYTGPPDHDDVTMNTFMRASSSPRWDGSFAGGASFPSHSDHVTVDVTEKGGLPWGYCQRCEMDVPPRAVHCRFCSVCVLRRDHHCHMVGCCIGHWNQRFFVAMAANAMVLGSLGAYLTVTYLYDHHQQHDTLWNYFLPVTLVKWLLGEVSSLQTLLTFHAYMLCAFAPISSHYFATQICLIGIGKTKREVQRRLKMVVTSSVFANFRQVFGYCWWLSLFLPAPHLFFPQLHQGLHYDNVKMVPD